MQEMITEIRITDKRKEGRKLLATASVTFNNDWVTHGIAIIEGKDGKPYVRMPDWKDKKGKYWSVCQPLNDEFRQYFEKAVLDAYEEKMAA